MSYNIDFSRDSPNFTPGASSPATFGRARTIEAIAIHWWGDPNQNPSYEGIVNHLCNPNAGVSAHFVATGTGRRVAQIVNFSDVSWATNSANPYTVSIECDPRCRDEDYDVVAELISQIRDAYGPLPLVPHRQFVSTACPGNYDLGRLDAIANTKNGSGDWGTVVPKEAPKPTPAPTPTNKPVPSAVKLEKPIDFKAKLPETRVWNLETNPNYEYVKTLGLGEPFQAYGKIEFNGSTYYVAKFSYDRNIKNGVNAVDLQEVIPPVVVTPPVTPTPEPTPVDPTTPETPSEGTESPSKVSLDESSTTLLQDVKKLLQELLDAIKKIFKQ